jgi:hypothetical protein
VPSNFLGCEKHSLNSELVVGQPDFVVLNDIAVQMKNNPKVVLELLDGPEWNRPGLRILTLTLDCRFKRRFI